MSDDYPWTMIGGDIPVEVLAKLVESDATWGSYITEKEASELWVNGWQRQPSLFELLGANQLAKKLNEGDE